MEEQASLQICLSLWVGTGCSMEGALVLCSSCSRRRMCLFVCVAETDAVGGGHCSLSWWSGVVWYELVIGGRQRQMESRVSIS